MQHPDPKMQPQPAGSHRWPRNMHVVDIRRFGIRRFGFDGSASSVRYLLVSGQGESPSHFGSMVEAYSPST